VQAEAAKPKVAAVLRPRRGVAAATAAAPAAPAFGAGDDDDGDGVGATGRRRLKKLTYTEEELAAVGQAPTKKKKAAAKTPPPPSSAAEALNARVMAIIRSIPTDAAAVLEYPIDWGAYDSVAASVAPRARRWVERRVATALGADDDALVDHVMGLVASHASGARVASELAPVLDDDATPFAVGLVRLLILEVTKAKEGLLT
jgi:PWI domain